MDEDVKKEIDDLQGQLRILVALYDDLGKRLDAVQDLAVTISAFARLTEKMLSNHLNALAAVVADTPATKPAKRGPEVG